jgi:hypothetical protein
MADIFLLNEIVEFLGACVDRIGADKTAFAHYLKDFLL